MTVSTSQIRQDYEPRIEAARELLQDSRASAWLPFDVVCGYKVRHFDLNAWVYLRDIGNAFVAGGMPMDSDIVSLLWAIQPDWVFGSMPSKSFLKGVLKLSYAKSVDELNRYIDRTFIDIPETQSGDKKKKRTSIEISHFAASWVVRFARELGWTDQYVMSTPLLRLIQLNREMSAKDGDKSVYTDAVIDLEVEMMDAIRKAESE